MYRWRTAPSYFMLTVVSVFWRKTPLMGWSNNFHFFNLWQVTTRVIVTSRTRLLVGLDGNRLIPYTSHKDALRDILVYGHRWWRGDYYNRSISYEFEVWTAWGCEGYCWLVLRTYSFLLRATVCWLVAGSFWTSAFKAFCNRWVDGACTNVKARATV